MAESAKPAANSWARRVLDRRVSLRFLLLCVLVVLSPEIYRLLKPISSETFDEFQEDKKGIGVNDLITEVKSELEQVDNERRKKGEAALFEVKTFDLEITFTAHKHVSKKGEVTYHLITVSGESQRSSERSQKILLHLETAPPEPLNGKNLPSISDDGNSQNEMGPAPPRRERKKP